MIETKSTDKSTDDKEMT